MVWLIAWVGVWVGGDKVPRLAIVDFDVAGSASQKEKRHYDLSEEEKEALGLAMVLMGEMERELQVEFDIVERRKLDAIRGERGIALDESSKPHEVVQMWKLFAADYTLVGTITEFRAYKKEFNSKHYGFQTETMVYHLAASFRMIESRTGKVIVVGSEGARTDSLELRRNRLDDSAYRAFLCRKLALAVRKRLVRDLRARE